MEQNYKYIAAGLIIVIIVIIITWYNNYYCSDYLYGMWEADKEFCEESGVTSMMVMMGPSLNKGLGDKRKMHVLIYDDTSVVLNDTLDITISPTYSAGEYKYKNIKINTENSVFPEQMRISLSVKNGHMVFYGRDDPDMIFMSLYKDHDSTHKAKLINNIKASDESSEESSSESSEN